jgi:chorismate synthase
MSSVWGNNIKLSLFGESHGAGVGIVIDGLPPGIVLDEEMIKEEMHRRAPKKDGMSTPRNEKDAYEILSGFFNGRTTGTPLAALIRNKDTRSKDYTKTKDFMRPSHGDYTGNIRYGGFNDYRGGGHFSGRLTAPIVFAGAVAKQVIKVEYLGVKVGSRIFSIGETEDRKLGIEEYHNLAGNFANNDFPLYTAELEEKMKQTILDAAKKHDSVGGVIECFVTGLPEGMGSPFFQSVESRLAAFLFSVPAVKGVEFGTGFPITKLRGSQSNDSMTLEDGKVVTVTNHNGGIVGGITNGMPLVFRTAIKPTPSIGTEQKTINISTMEETTFTIQGRHDPCIVHRAVPVIESAAALVILDIIMEKNQYEGFK